MNLQDFSQWWRWVPGARWSQPAGPGSTLDGKADHPVVQVSFADAAAYAQWAGKDLPRWAVSFAARSSDSARLRSRADLIWSTDRF